MNRRASEVLLLSLLAMLLGFLLFVAVVTWLTLVPRFPPRVYWVFESSAYKQAVLSLSSKAGLRHVEWRGDGWGGVGGDWTGYVVYDPSDSLPLKGTNGPAVRVKGIPCDVVSVRRMEKDWYSVVTDMNQFWDSAHPGC